VSQPLAGSSSTTTRCHAMLRSVVGKRWNRLGATFCCFGTNDRRPYHVLPPYSPALYIPYRERGRIGCHGHDCQQINTSTVLGASQRIEEPNWSMAHGRIRESSAADRHGTQAPPCKKSSSSVGRWQGQQARHRPCTDAAAVRSTEAERRGHAPCCQLVTAPTDTTRGVPVPSWPGSESPSCVAKIKARLN
jgi:hypothetical protein